MLPPQHDGVCGAAVVGRAAQRARGRPFGEAAWREKAIKDLGLQSSERERGRPKKKRAGVA